MGTMISVGTAVTLTDLSRRTLWRRIGGGLLPRGKDDERGRAMLEMKTILPFVVLPPLDPSDLEVIEKADAGEAEAQNDVAMLLLGAGRHRSAVYWLDRAARQDYPEAMSLLARCYIEGTGVDKDENLGIMWLAKAAASGHHIAREQMAAILPNRARRR
jgi:hypothetical protein